MFETRTRLAIDRLRLVANWPSEAAWPAAEAMFRSGACVAREAHQAVEIDPASDGITGECSLGDLHQNRVFGMERRHQYR
jgi:hypothetical protein